MPGLIGLAILASVVLVGLLIYLIHKSTEAKKGTINELEEEVESLTTENSQLRQLLNEIRYDAVRHERDEPRLATQIQNRITTHSLFREEIEKELGT